MQASVFLFAIVLSCAAAPTTDQLIEAFEQASRLHQAHDYAAAAAAYRSLLDQIGESHEPPGLEARVYNALGSLYQDLGEFDQSEQSYRRALHYFTRLPQGAGRRLSIHVLANLGSLYLDTRQFGRLRETCREAAALVQEDDESSPEQARILHLAGLSAAIDGRRDEAAASLRASLAMWRQLGRPYRRQTADTLNSLGTLAFEAGHFGEALRCFEEALRLFDASPSTPNRAATQINVACALAQLRRFDEAAAAYSEAMRVLEQTVGLRHAYAAHAMLSYAAALEHAGRKKPARELRRQAEAILEANRGRDVSRHVVDIVELGGQ